MASSSTRHSILDILKREGPQDAASLARRLGITPMAVGLQLSSLESEKLVKSQSEPSNPPRRGRPVQIWSLTEAAGRIFPDAHALLTVGLLTSLNEVYGEQGLRKLLEVRTRQQVEEYRTSVRSGPLKDRVKALAGIRDREGYMTEVSSTAGGGFLLVENHCPICTAARTCQGFCESEKQVFQEILGPDVKVTREEHILSGARRCVYSIRPKPSLTES
jgi:predicted ArsR family transcriptional regulator